MSWRELPWHLGHTPAHSLHCFSKGCGAAWSLAWLCGVVGAAHVGRCPATYAEAKCSAEVEEGQRECEVKGWLQAQSKGPYCQKGVQAKQLVGHYRA
jgi:hypothetical protein